MANSPGGVAFKLAYELSPIILTNGFANFMPQGVLPIIAITESINFVGGILSGGSDIDLDDFFAHYVPLPGSTLIDQEAGEYPFANQAVAANAVITKPLMISLRMICPVKDTGWSTKLAIMTALQATLKQHNALGGTYTVLTPSHFYTNCILLSLVDTSATESRQPQNTYQWNFRQPLLTLQDAIQAQNGLMSKISAGVPSGAPLLSGLSSTVAQPPSLGSIGLVPVTSNTAGASIAAPSQSQ